VCEYSNGVFSMQGVQLVMATIGWHIGNYTDFRSRSRAMKDDPEDDLGLLMVCV